MFQRQATFQEAVVSALQLNYCNFNGRASRSQYWYFVLFNVIIGILCTILTAIIGNAGTIITYIIDLALLLPGLGLAVRRLHDINKSGWFLLLSLIPLVGAIILIIWFCKDSEMQPNQYGPVPMLETK